MVDFSLVIWGLPVAPRAKDSGRGAFIQNLGANRFERLNAPYCWSAISGQWLVVTQWKPRSEWWRLMEQLCLGCMKTSVPHALSR